MARFVLAHTRLAVAHLLHLLPYGSRIIAQVNAVAERFAHLGLAVSSRESHTYAVLWKQDFRLQEHLTVDAVELADDFAGLLQHRLLVLAGRHDCSLECGNVRSLADRVAKESCRKRILELPHLDFGLHGRISLKPGHRHEIQVIECQLGKLRNHGLYEQCAFVRVDAA